MYMMIMMMMMIALCETGEGDVPPAYTSTKSPLVIEVISACWSELTWKSAMRHKPHKSIRKTESN